MAAQLDRSQSQASLSSKERGIIELVENAQDSEADNYLHGFDLLAGKSKEELALLNKKVLRKLDWKFLPCITAMLLMK